MRLPSIMSHRANRTEPRPGGRARSRLALVCGTLGLAAAAVTSTTATSAGATAKSSGPDFSFYAGKTITFITGGSPGGANDELALILAPLMGSYLHATVKVEDIPAGATVPAQDDTAASPPDGLTFGQGGPIGNIENEIQNIPDVNFHMLKMEYIGGASPAQYVIATLPSTHIHTLAQLVKSKSPTKFLALSGGGQLTEAVMLKAYGMNASLVFGYANGGALAQGFLRGDGTASIINPPSIAGAIENGQVTPLAMIAPYTKGDPAYAQLAKLPTLAQYVAANPPKTRAGRKAMQVLLTFDQSSNQVLFTAAGTPQARVAALAAAFHSAIAQPSAQSALINAGVPNGYFSGTAVRQQITEMIKEAPVLLPFLH